MALANTYAFIGSVGPQSASGGATPLVRLGPTGEQVIQGLHGRYYETAYRKQLFYAYTAVTLLSVASAAPSGTFLWNRTNGVNLVLQKIFLQVSVTSASLTGIALQAGPVGNQTAAPTGQTAATSYGSAFIGGGFPSALALNAATVTTTGAVVANLAHNTAAIAVTGADQLVVDLEGSIIVPPFTWVSLCALGGNSAAAAVSSTMFWEEVLV